jgi:glutathione synthase/RimK-type ligase-like ATP-grasp enzyme
MILAITVENDVHALAVQRALMKRGYDDYRILACNKIASSHRLRVDQNNKGGAASIEFPDGYKLDVGSIRLVWWRRIGADQDLDAQTSDDFQAKLINNDCRGALGGILQTYFKGTWVSCPDATVRASDKIYQLAVAKEAGFRVPETLVSQSKEEVKEFCARWGGQVIVKPVVGAAGPILFTQLLGDVNRFEERSFQMAPAIYQEYIPGDSHIRLNCFGDKSYAALIETRDLDWRPNLNVPIKSWPVPDWLHRRVRATLDQLELEIGIVDLKLMSDDEVVWLEVNPQGQFLFLEGLTGVPLAEHFAEFLISLCD